MMPLTARERVRLTKAAEAVAKASGVAAEDRGDYVEAYVAAVEKINSRIDARMEDLESGLAETIVDIAPGDAQAVAAHITAQIDLVRKAADTVTTFLGEIHHPGIRSMTAAALMDILSYYMDTITEAQAAGDLAADVSRD